MTNVEKLLEKDRNSELDKGRIHSRTVEDIYKVLVDLSNENEDYYEYMEDYYISENTEMIKLIHEEFISAITDGSTYSTLDRQNIVSCFDVIFEF